MIAGEMTGFEKPVAPEMVIDPARFVWTLGAGHIDRALWSFAVDFAQPNPLCLLQALASRSTKAAAPAAMDWSAIYPADSIAAGARTPASVCELALGRLSHGLTRPSMTRPSSR